MLLFEDDEFESIKQVTEPNQTVKWRRVAGSSFRGTIQPFYSSTVHATLGADASTNLCFLLTSDAPPVKNKDIVRSKRTGKAYAILSKPEISDYDLVAMPGPDLNYFQTKVDRLDYTITDDQL